MVGADLPCEICGGPINADEPDSVDHITPVERGGSNELENLRRTHWYCNIRRGSRALPSTRPSGLWHHPNPLVPCARGSRLSFAGDFYVEIAPAPAPLHQARLWVRLAARDAVDARRHVRECFGGARTLYVSGPITPPVGWALRHPQRQRRQSAVTAPSSVQSAAADGAPSRVNSAGPARPPRGSSARTRSSAPSSRRRSSASR